MTEERRSQLRQAANICLDARRTGDLIENLPANLQPQTLQEAYAMQDAMMEAYLPVGGWKIGGPPADDPFYAPMPRAWMAATGSTLKGIRFRAVEAELAFLMGKDLPPRETPYTREEVTAAIASFHPAIEVLEMAFPTPAGKEKFTLFGDMQQHGGFVYGAAIPDWQKLDLTQESVKLTIDGKLIMEKTASNPAGTDLLRLPVFLANQGDRTGGLKKGDWITTGSWTGNTPAGADAVVDVHFKHAGHVTLRFA